MKEVTADGSGNLSATWRLIAADGGTVPSRSECAGGGGLELDLSRTRADRGGRPGRLRERRRLRRPRPSRARTRASQRSGGFSSRSPSLS